MTDAQNSKKDVNRLTQKMPNSVLNTKFLISPYSFILGQTKELSLRM